MRAAGTGATGNGTPNDSAPGAFFSLPRRLVLPPVVLLSLFLLAAIIAPLPAESLRVHFIDVGQGEAVLLQTENAAVLVDAGRNATVADYLEQRGVSRIDLAVATHAHADHVGGFPAVFGRLPVERVWYNGQTHTTRTFERFLDAILESEAQYREPMRGEKLQLDGMTITVLHPAGSAADYGGHLHDMSIVIRVEYGAFSLILTGDAEIHAETAILQWVRAGTGARAGTLPGDPEGLRSTVLQLGHHGSYTSSGTAFLRAVLPQIAVYQAGQGNRYGHPHDAVIRRLETITAAQVLGTDRHGTIVIETDGTVFSVQTER